MEKIANKVALVTGGSKGIGYGIAEALLKENARVAITSRSAESLNPALEKLKTIGSGEVIGLVADVKNATDQQQTVNAVLSKWKSLDVLVANAGLGHFDSIENLTLEQWQDTMDTNLTGVFNSVKATLPALKASKGYIITIASLAGTNFFAGGSAYNASKFGLVGFSQAIMLDLRSYGIKVTTIMPGSVATHFNNDMPDEKDAWKIQPEDIGKLVVDLLTMHPRTLPSKIEVRPSMPGK